MGAEVPSGSRPSCLGAAYESAPAGRDGLPRTGRQHCSLLSAPVIPGWSDSLTGGLRKVPAGELRVPDLLLQNLVRSVSRIRAIWRTRSRISANRHLKRPQQHGLQPAFVAITASGVRAGIIGDFKVWPVDGASGDQHGVSGIRPARGHSYLDEALRIDPHQLIDLDLAAACLRVLRGGIRPQ